MAGENPTPQEYISHHLTNLTYGKLPAGYERVDYDGNSQVLEQAQWTFRGHRPGSIRHGLHGDHVDTMGWSIGLGIVFCWLFYRSAQRATAGVPSGLLNFVEMIVDFIDDNVKSIFHHNNPWIAPLGLTILSGSSCKT